MSEAAHSFDEYPLGGEETTRRLRAVRENEQVKRGKARGEISLLMGAVKAGSIEGVVDILRSADRVAQMSWLLAQHPADANPFWVVSLTKQLLDDTADAYEKRPTVLCDARLALLELACAAKRDSFSLMVWAVSTDSSPIRIARALWMRFTTPTAANY